MRLESSIQSEFIKKLKRRRRMYKKKHKPVSYKHPPYPVGIPDIHHIEAGLTLWIEVKRSEHDKPTPIQLKRHKLLRAAGAHVLVAWEWNQVAQWLKLYIKEQS